MSYRTLDGTAKTSDVVYVAKTGTLTFNPGETTKTVTSTPALSRPERGGPFHAADRGQ